LWLGYIIKFYKKAGYNILSSSVIVYGAPQYLTYDEEHSTTPINPYGRTKLIIKEIILNWVATNEIYMGTILRYFNPDGAHSSGKII
jgi:UDP-glucose 4-epimerase